VEELTAAQDTGLSASKAKQIRPDCKSDWLPMQMGRCCDETSRGTDGTEEFNSVRQENVVPRRILASLLTWQ
jgi:hypothetical protein